MKRITSTALAALKPGRDNGEIVIDPGERGHGALILRVTATGKPFYYRYFHEGRKRLELVGHFDPKGAAHWRRGGESYKGGPLSLAAAREGYRELVLLREAVGDLKAHFADEQAKVEEARKQAEVLARAGTFGDLLEVYVKALEAAGKASARDIRKILERNVSKPFPELVKQRANEITSEDIQTILARVTKRGATRQVNVVRSYLRAAFQYGGRGHDFDPRRLATEGKAFRLRGNPVDLVPRIAEFERIGERVLSAAEIRAYFKALDSIPNPVTRAALQLHILTGAQRPKQLTGAPWSSYDLEHKVVTLVDRKGRADARTHLVPLLPEAVKLLKRLKAEGGHFEWPFTNFGDVPVRLETLAAAVREIANSKGGDGKPVFDAPFTLRDIRRTVETTLAALGISKETRAQLLSHGRGDKIARTYDKHHYLAEKRHALEAWRDFLKSRKTAGNVVALRKGS